VCRVLPGDVSDRGRETASAEADHGPLSKLRDRAAFALRTLHGSSWESARSLAERDAVALASKMPLEPVQYSQPEEVMKKQIAKKLELKKVVLKKLSTKTGIKGGTTNNSCTGHVCYTR
jgi:hypothetical protein